jgi:FAD/FMN-containing dehydrogenase
VSRAGEEATAVRHRKAQYAANLMSLWTDPADADRQVAWTRELWPGLEPLTTGGVFVNSLGDEGQDRVRAAYGAATYERLVALKNRYDPTNLFRLNQNIKPMV